MAGDPVAPDDRGTAPDQFVNGTRIRIRIHQVEVNAVLSLLRL